VNSTHYFDYFCSERESHQQADGAVFHAAEAEGVSPVTTEQNSPAGVGTEEVGWYGGETEGIGTEGG